MQETISELTPIHSLHKQYLMVAAIKKEMNAFGSCFKTKRLILGKFLVLFRILNGPSIAPKQENRPIH